MAARIRFVSTTKIFGLPVENVLPWSWVSSALNLLGLTRAFSGGLVQCFFGMSFSGRAAFDVGEGAGRYRMSDLGFELNLQLARDFHIHRHCLLWDIFAAWAVPFPDVQAYSVMRALAVLKN
jgi:hypothetical protein